MIQLELSFCKNFITGRVKKMFELYKSGLTLREVGVIYCVTHERIRQIFEKYNLKIRTHSHEKVKVFCNACGKELIKSKKSIKHNKKNFCDKSCWRKWGLAQHKEVKCDCCGETIKRTLNYQSHKKTKYNFCSMDCFSKFVKNNETENHYNTSMWHKERNEARKIVEKAIGRKLEEKETTHHIDRDHSNNDIENLMLFKNNSDHQSWHRETFKNPPIWWGSTKSLEELKQDTTEINLLKRKKIS